MSEKERKEWYSFFNKFHTTLKDLSEASCHGCRNNTSSDNGCIKGCVIPTCAKEHGIDFCAECDDFPCQKASDFFLTHDDKIGVAWKSGSKRIKDIGVDAYFEEKKYISHYIHYK